MLPQLESFLHFIHHRQLVIPTQLYFFPLPYRGHSATSATVDTCDNTPLPVHRLGCLLISATEYSDIYGEAVPDDRCDSKIGLLISLTLMTHPLLPSSYLISRLRSANNPVSTSISIQEFNPWYPVAHLGLFDNLTGMILLPFWLLMAPVEYYSLVGDYVVPVDGCELRAQPLVVQLTVQLIAGNVWWISWPAYWEPFEWLDERPTGWSISDVSVCVDAEVDIVECSWSTVLG